MKKNDILEYFGRGVDIAKTLEIEPQAFYQWEEDKVPYGRQLEIEKLTNGKLKAVKSKRSKQKSN
jgi:hypothetical protein